MVKSVRAASTLMLEVLLAFCALACPMVGHHTAARGALAAFNKQSAALITGSAVTTCAWIRLPPTLTVADSDANYWVMLAIAQAGSSLVITGTFPSARYVALQVYTSSGQVVTDIPDVAFPPDAGSVNPFLASSPRGVGTYTLSIVFGPPPAQPAPATFYANVPSGTPVAVWYRVYLPDTGATPTGNVSLPTLIPNNRASMCPATTTHRAAGHLNSMSWLVRLHLQHLLRPLIQSWHGSRRVWMSSMAPIMTTPKRIPFVGVTTSSIPVFRGGGGNNFDNADAAYLWTLLPVPLLYTVHFQVPTTPRTLAGEPITPGVQLRYWSLCVYLKNGASYLCLPDEQIPVAPDGTATVELGPASAQPSTTSGISWISLDSSAFPYWVVIRNLLPAPSFTESAFAVPHGNQPAPYMGAYAPVLTTSAITTTNSAPEPGTLKLRAAG